MIPSEIKIYAKNHGLLRIAIPSGAKATSTNEVYLQCPLCSNTRKPEHQKLKPFSFNIKTNGWRCKHCGEAGFVLSDDDFNKKHVKPLKNSKITLKKFEKEDPRITWFKNRGISLSTIEHLNITSSKKKMLIKYHDNKELIGSYMLRDCIAFPFTYKGQLVNIQYRDKFKNFTMESGADLVFYNIDNLSKDCDWVVITEGLIDTASYIESDIKEVVSVPNGVTLSVAEKEEFERTGTFSNIDSINLSYVTKCYDDFANKKTIFIATDADAAGVKLRLALARRFGEERCKFIDFSKYKRKDDSSCKDGNDVLITFGRETLRDTLLTASMFPNKEIFDIDNNYVELMDNFGNEGEKGIPLNVAGLDGRFSTRLGHTLMINGFPNHGKTTFIFWVIILTIINPKTKYVWGIYSPENYPVKNALDIMVEIFLGNTLDQKVANCITKTQYRKAIEFLRDKVYFIDREDGYTPDELRAIKKDLMRRYGCNAFLTDPWNALIENSQFGENSHNWLVKQLSAEQRFSTRNRVYNVITVHPTTPKKNKEGEYDHPTTFEVDGGKIWAAKMYDMMCAHREDINDLENTNIEVYVQKIKFQKLCGYPNYEKNPIILRFIRRSNRYLDQNGEDPVEKLKKKLDAEQLVLTYNDFIES